MLIVPAMKITWAMRCHIKKHTHNNNNWYITECCDRSMVSLAYAPSMLLKQMKIASNNKQHGQCVTVFYLLINYLTDSHHIAKYVLCYQELEYLVGRPRGNIYNVDSLCYQYYQRVWFKSLTVSLFNIEESDNFTSNSDK